MPIFSEMHGGRVPVEMASHLWSGSLLKPRKKCISEGKGVHWGEALAKCYRDMHYIDSQFVGPCFLE